MFYESSSSPVTNKDAEGMKGVSCPSYIQLLNGKPGTIVWISRLWGVGFVYCHLASQQGGYYAEV